MMTRTTSSTRCVRAAGVDAEQARVAEGAQPAADRVGQPALLAHVLEQPRAHRPAEQRVEARAPRSVPGGSGGRRRRPGRCGSARGPCCARRRGRCSTGGDLDRRARRLPARRRTPARRARAAARARCCRPPPRSGCRPCRRARSTPAARPGSGGSRCRPCRGSARPRGWPLQNRSRNSSWTRSSGMSSTILISSPTTPFSRSMSSGAKRGWSTTSDSTSTARGRCSSRTLMA